MGYRSKYINKHGEEKDRKEEVRFLDSYRFVDDNLANLASNLPPESFEILKTYFPYIEKFNLLLRKGVFPYDRFDGFDRLNNTKLPPIEDFYSRLNDCGIEDEDYQHAKKVWETFDIKIFKEYHDTYLKDHTARLADVFENFIKLCMANYGLDPANYFTASGMFWDALFKITGHK